MNDIIDNLIDRLEEAIQFVNAAYGSHNTTLAKRTTQDWQAAIDSARRFQERELHLTAQ
jgi:hypothetical protein